MLFLSWVPNYQAESKLEKPINTSFSNKNATKNNLQNLFSKLATILSRKWYSDSYELLYTVSHVLQKSMIELAH